jgi:hypothetical protein
MEIGARDSHSKFPHECDLLLKQDRSANNSGNYYRRQAGSRWIVE